MKYRRSILPRSSAPCHNGSESCIFLSLRKPRNRPTPARGTSRGTPVLRPSVPCHNGSGSCIFLPLRKYRNRPSPARGTSRGIPVLRPLPQRQRIPHFPAIAEALEPASPARDSYRATSLLRPLPQRQRNPYFPAVADALEPAYPRGRHLLDCFAPTPLATTAAESAFSCRCGCLKWQ